MLLEWEFSPKLFQPFFTSDITLFRVKSSWVTKGKTDVLLNKIMSEKCVLSFGFSFYIHGPKHNKAFDFKRY